MPRSIWTGTISFGLVTVPVKLYSAQSSKTVRFNQLNPETGARVMQKRVDASTGEEVEYSSIVKGFEITSGRYVVIDPAELAAVQPEKTKTIEIEDFVELDAIDPIFFDHSYYLAPATGGAKPYRLLVQALTESGRVGIARMVMRQKESLVAIRPMGDVLGLVTMLFADEVVDPSSVEDLAGVAEVKTTKRELEIAEQLISAQAGDFDPSKYRDSYREAVIDMIERKAAGEEIVDAPVTAEEEEQAPTDLMEALKASIAAVQARTGESTVAKKKPKPAAAKKPAAKKSASKKP